MKTAKLIPHIGARIVKSSVGVAICMLIYYIRELLPFGSGMPFYSALSVLWCTQPYTDTMKTMVKQRTIGTGIGALYGLAFLLFFGLFETVDRMVIYLTAALLIIPILYTTVLIHKRNASYFSCVVFLSIAITHSFDADPYLFVFNRVLDTVIGMGVAYLLNAYHLPLKNKDKVLYVSGIDSVLVSDHRTMTPYNKVELNRLISQGAHFTVSTVNTPASLIELMRDIRLKLPVIAMDGAVLYDIKENRYLKVFPLDADLAAKAERIIGEEGIHCFVNALYDDTLLIYYGTFVNDKERDLFERMRRSPYRNYTDKRHRFGGENERVVYLMALVPQADAAWLYDRLVREIGSETRIVRADSEYEGYDYVKVYDKRACKANMMRYLIERTGAEKTVTFGSIKGEYDVYIHDGGVNEAVKILKKLCEGGKMPEYAERVNKKKGSLTEGAVDEVD